MAKTSFLLALTASLIAPMFAIAEDVPEFNERGGFEVVSVTDDSAVVVNRDVTFLCDAERTETIVALSDCLPVMGPAASAEIVAAERAAEEARVKSQEELIAALPSMPFQDVNAIILSMFEALDCSVDISDQDASEDLLVRAFADNVGLDQPLSEDVYDEIWDLLENTFDVLLSAQTVVVNEATMSVSHTGCS